MMITDDSHETVGNEKRALWRNICRKRLADHLYGCNRNKMIEKGTEITVATLGIRLKPSDVRLKPPEGDRIYIWKVQSLNLRPLFKKNLSKHSVGA